MADRYLSVFQLQLEAVHDGHPEYFGDRLSAEVNEVLRGRLGLDDAHVTGMSWRVVVEPDEPHSPSG